MNSRVSQKCSKESSRLNLADNRTKRRTVRKKEKNSASPPQRATRRWWIFLRAGGAVTLYFPKTLLPNPNAGGNALDILVYGGPGIEYYTRLRHFSIALEADFCFQILTQTIGINIMPTLRYAF